MGTPPDEKEEEEEEEGVASSIHLLDSRSETMSESRPNWAMIAAENVPMDTGVG